MDIKAGMMLTGSLLTLAGLLFLPLSFKTFYTAKNYERQDYEQQKEEIWPVSVTRFT